MIDLPTTLHAPPPTWTPRFDVPEAVTAIDLTEGPAATATRMTAQARSALPGVTADQVAHLVAAQRAVVDALVAGGAFWAGSCLARSDADPGRITVAHLAASVVDLDPGRLNPGCLDPGHLDPGYLEVGRLDAAAVVAGLNGGAGPGDPVELVADVIALPAGPALVVISEHDVRATHTVFDTPDGCERRVRQILVGMQVPESARLAVLTLATEHLADWPAYLELMATISRSIRFAPGERPAPPPLALHM